MMMMMMNEIPNNGLCAFELIFNLFTLSLYTCSVFKHIGLQYLGKSSVLRGGRRPEPAGALARLERGVPRCAPANEVGLN